MCNWLKQRKDSRPADSEQSDGRGSGGYAHQYVTGSSKERTADRLSFLLEPLTRLELATCALRMRCSTD